MAGEEPSLSQRETSRLIEIGEAVQRREDTQIEERWAAHLRQHAEHDKAHAIDHSHEAEETRLREQAIETANEAHDKEHESQKEAVKTALAGVDRLAATHSLAHDREHAAHETRHADQRIAVEKAEQAVDKRLEAMNQIRAQLNDQARTFATGERLEALIHEIGTRFEALNIAIDRRFIDTAKHTDDRYENNRQRIEALEKGDVKAEGRSLGQGAVIAIIVTAIGVAGTVLAIIITLANVATGNP